MTHAVKIKTHEFSSTICAVIRTYYKVGERGDECERQRDGQAQVEVVHLAELEVPHLFVLLRVLIPVHVLSVL